MKESKKFMGHRVFYSGPKAPTPADIYRALQDAYPEIQGEGVSDIAFCLGRKEINSLFLTPTSSGFALENVGIIKRSKWI